MAEKMVQIRQVCTEVLYLIWASGAWYPVILAEVLDELLYGKPKLSLDRDTAILVRDDDILTHELGQQLSTEKLNIYSVNFHS